MFEDDLDDCNDQYHQLHHDVEEEEMKEKEEEMKEKEEEKEEEADQFDASAKCERASVKCQTFHAETPLLLSFSFSLELINLLPQH